jgi:hypothetical protein
VDALGHDPGHALEGRSAPPELERDRDVARRVRR